MTKELRVWAAALTLALIGAVQACATSKPPASPECSNEQLAKIEAAYIAEATEACAGKTYDACAELAAIREKYQAKREAWKSCSK